MQERYKARAYENPEEYLEMLSLFVANVLKITSSFLFRKNMHKPIDHVAHAYRQAALREVSAWRSLPMSCVITNEMTLIFDTECLLVSARVMSLMSVYILCRVLSIEIVQTRVACLSERSSERPESVKPIVARVRTCSQEGKKDGVKGVKSQQAQPVRP
jgi:hypothetical protein